MGHIVRFDGIIVDPAKIVVVRNWPKRKTPTDI